MPTPEDAEYIYVVKTSGAVIKRFSQNLILPTQI